MPCHVIQCHVMSCNAMSWSCHVRPCHDTTTGCWHITRMKGSMQCNDILWHVMSWHNMSCPVITCHDIPCHVMSCKSMSWHDDTMTGCWQITRFCSETKNSGLQTILNPHRKVDKGATLNVKWHKMAHTKMQKNYFSMIFIPKQSQKARDMTSHWFCPNLGAPSGTSIPHSAKAAQLPTRSCRWCTPKGVFDMCTPSTNIWGASS